MTPYLSIAVDEPSQVGQARRAAVRLANEIGFDEVASGKVALVVTELAGNLARHARHGRILLGSRVLAGAPSSLEVLSLDDGPGMADVHACLRDGYSTGGTPGTGLGAVRRLASEFSAYSSPGKGTVVLARLCQPTGFGAPAAPPAQFRSSGVCLAAPGETVSGDSWGIRVDGDKAFVMVADGLGHGPVAAEASEAAIRVFESAPGAPSAVLDRAHQALRSTRGAAVAMAELDTRAGSVTFAGAGNIVGRLISGVEDRSLLSQHGTLGVQIRRLSDATQAWPEHACLILHSDGIISRWNLADTPGLLQCDPAVIAGWLVRAHCRGRDDVTVVVIRRA